MNDLFFKRNQGHKVPRVSNILSETVAFLDVQIYHITKDVGHINNKVLSKTVQRYGVFLVLQAISTSFFLFLLQI